jgi:hypothetical protein
MAVSQVGNLGNLATGNLKIQTKVQKPLNTNNTNVNANVKADSLFLSEKAKDLAAKQAGKAFQEEQNESETSKLKEM